MVRGRRGDERKRPAYPIPASFAGLVAGVFRSPNLFPSQVMVRSEPWRWRFPAELGSQGGRCGSVVSPHRDGPATMLKGWSGFLHADVYSCLPNNWAQVHPQFVLQHCIEEARRIANRRHDDRRQDIDPLGQSSLKQYLRLTVGPYRDPPPAPAIVPPSNPRLPSPASGDVRDRRRTRDPESFAPPVTTPADNAIGHPLPPSADR
jgi:hypothetical protein